MNINKQIDDIISDIRNKMSPLTNFFTMASMEDSSPELRKIIRDEFEKCPLMLEKIEQGLTKMRDLINMVHDFEPFVIPDTNDKSWIKIGTEELELNDPYWLRMSDGKILMGWYGSNVHREMGWWQCLVHNGNIKIHMETPCPKDIEYVSPVYDRR